MDELAEWRLDSAAIEFPQDTRECHGGFATVLRARLVKKSGNEGSRINGEHEAGENGSNGTGSSQKVRSGSAISTPTPGLLTRTM